MDDVSKHDKTEPSDGSNDFKTNVSGDRWIGAFEAFSDIFERIRKNPEPAIVMVVAYVVLDLISTFIKLSDHLPYGNHFEYNLAMLLTFVFLLAAPTYALALASGKKITVSEFMRFDLRKYLVVLLAGALSFLIISISALALIVPVIWTAAWFALVSYIAVDKGTGVMETLRESKRLTENHKGKVWGIVGVTILVFFASGILGAALGWIPYLGQAIYLAATTLLSVISAGASALLYRWLQRNVPASEEQKATSAAPVE